MKKSLVAISCLGLMMSAGLVLGQEKGKGGKGKGGAAPVGDVAKGKDVFAANCAVCHKSDSEERVVGPGLKGLSKHAMLVTGKPVTDANINSILNDGTANGMPPFGPPVDAASRQERADIIAFLKSL
jgi:mono/diheme cytochrome c family protein